MALAYANGQARVNMRVHRFSAVQRVMGLLLMVFSTTMLPPLAVSLLYGNDVERPFLMGLWITLAGGAAVWWPVRHNRDDLKLRDGFLVVVLFWSVLSAFAAIPLMITEHAWPTYTEAVFEAVSGFTTTGATTVASGLDRLPEAFKFYRGLLQWLGGMGIIVLAVAILPMLGIGGMQLYRAETSGPMKESKLTPRIAETARAMWLIYVSLTAACGLLYWLFGMSAFDAVCHAFTTISTAGFSTHDASIGYFDSAWIETTCIVFMLLGATNFTLHFRIWRSGDVLTYVRDAEFRAWLALMAGFCVVVSLALYFTGTYGDGTTAFRKAVFNVVSFGTTTGYVTADPTPWPGPLPLIMMLAAFMTGCGGSTAGGVKVVRLLLFVKQAFREMQRLIHPSAELPLKLGGRSIPDSIVYAVGGFFSVYVGFTILLTFVMIALGLDPVTAFSAVAASINNLGPGLGEVSASVASLPTAGKWVMILGMLLGRLEIFTLLIILTPAFWRR